MRGLWQTYSTLREYAVEDWQPGELSQWKSIGIGLKLPVPGG